jgi:hypothetical protein
MTGHARSLLLLSLGLALWVALPGAATAAEPGAPTLNDDFSAADQYVESVPTAGGPKVPGVGTKPHRRAKREAPPSLPKSVESSLKRQPAQTAAKLERIATSADYGAPTKKLKEEKRGKSSPRIPTAQVSAVGEGEQSTLTWLLVALVSMTLLAAGTAGYRRYEAKKTSG